jgi:hypothetical protein
MQRAKILCWGTALFLGILMTGSVVAQGTSPGKLVILIKDVETPTTRANMGKYLDVKKKTVAYESSTLTDADRATLDPESLGKIRAQEIEDRQRAKQDERDEVKRDNEKRQTIAETLRQGAVGTDVGRNIIQAREWMAGALSSCSEFIQVVDRSEQETAMDEAARNNAAQTLRGGVTHYMRIIVGDTTETKTETESYGVKSVLVKKSLNVSVAINDLNDRQVFNKSFPGEVAQVHTSYGNTTGGDDHEEMLKSALEKAGEAVGKEFTARLTVDLIGPREEGDSFNPSVATIMVDDQIIGAGADVLLLKGTHTVKVESEDYIPYTKTFALKADTPLKIPLQSAFGCVKFAVPAQSGMDVSGLMIELIAKDGQQENLSGEGPHRVKKGAYSLKCVVDGFMPFENKNFAIGGGTQEKPVVVNIALKSQPSAPKPIPTP